EGVRARRERDAPGSLRLQQRGPQPRGELEVPEVVRGELKLEATGVLREGDRHDPGVVDEEMERTPRREKARGEGVDRCRLGELEALELHPRDPGQRGA